MSKPDCLTCGVTTVFSGVGCATGVCPIPAAGAASDAGPPPASPGPAQAPPAVLPPVGGPKMVGIDGRDCAPCDRTGRGGRSRNTRGGGVPTTAFSMDPGAPAPPSTGRFAPLPEQPAPPPVWQQDVGTMPNGGGTPRPPPPPVVVQPDPVRPPTPPAVVQPDPVIPPPVMVQPPPPVRIAVDEGSFGPPPTVQPLPREQIPDQPQPLQPLVGLEGCDIPAFAAVPELCRADSGLAPMNATCRSQLIAWLRANPGRTAYEYASTVGGELCWGEYQRFGIRAPEGAVAAVASALAEPMGLGAPSASSVAVKTAPGGAVYNMNTGFRVQQQNPDAECEAQVRKWIAAAPWEGRGFITFVQTYGNEHPCSRYLLRRYLGGQFPNGVPQPVPVKGKLVQPSGAAAKSFSATVSTVGVAGGEPLSPVYPGKGERGAPGGPVGRPVGPTEDECKTFFNQWIAGGPGRDALGFVRAFGRTHPCVPYLVFYYFGNDVQNLYRMLGPTSPAGAAAPAGPDVFAVFASLPRHLRAELLRATYFAQISPYPAKVAGFVEVGHDAIDGVSVPDLLQGWMLLNAPPDSAAAQRFVNDVAVLAAGNLPTAPAGDLFGLSLGLGTGFGLTPPAPTPTRPATTTTRPATTATRPATTTATRPATAPGAPPAPTPEELATRVLLAREETARQEQANARQAALVTGISTGVTGTVTSALAFAAQQRVSQVEEQRVQLEHQAAMARIEMERGNAAAAQQLQTLALQMQQNAAAAAQAQQSLQQAVNIAPPAPPAPPVEPPASTPMSTGAKVGIAAAVVTTLAAVGGGVALAVSRSKSAA